MSYILDALRRADAERQQGQVPGLHAAPAGDAAAPTRPAWPRVAGLLLLALVLGAAVAAWFWRAAPAPSPSGRSEQERYLEGMKAATQITSSLGLRGFLARRGLVADDGPGALWAQHATPLMTQRAALVLHAAR